VPFLPRACVALICTQALARPPCGAHGQRFSRPWRIHHHHPRTRSGAVLSCLAWRGMASQGLGQFLAAVVGRLIEDESCWVRIWPASWPEPGRKLRRETWAIARHRSWAAWAAAVEGDRSGARAVLPYPKWKIS